MNKQILKAFLTSAIVTSSIGSAFAADSDSWSNMSSWGNNSLYTNPVQIAPSYMVADKHRGPISGLVHAVTGTAGAALNTVSPGIAVTNYPSYGYGYGYTNMQVVVPNPVVAIPAPYVPYRRVFHISGNSYMSF